MKYINEYRASDLSRRLIDQISNVCRSDVCIMEVCGTHTVSIFRHGIRSVLPDNISLISGPGCPVCVTDQRDIDAGISLAGAPDTIVATFGDLLRVPGSKSSLQKEKADGKDIRIVYSTMDAIGLARENPDKQVVFLGVGFETTAPTVAASILSASGEKLGNYSVLSAHKLVPPALEALMRIENISIGGFLLPGHVSVIIGEKGYSQFYERNGIPCVIAGFEPTDILQAILVLAEMMENKTPALVNAYKRAVASNGNPAALEIMHRVFEVVDVEWRGLGRIPDSGLAIRKEFAYFDARKRFALPVFNASPPKGCACGEILTGRLTPPECPLYQRRCTPIDPVGPCMVSNEGTCAAYYRYVG